ncbi:4Fe-4S binding protein [Psychromonas sp.]|nr:4Fe-4S binding protein [Psychromonas sp.]
MPLKITKSCYSCYACETVCPSGAISIVGNLFVIDPAKCSECDDIESPRCIAICPEPGAIIRDNS